MYGIYDRNNGTFIRRHAEKLIFLMAVLFASLVTGLAVWQTDVKAQSELQQHLAGEVLRFHVLANSDSSEDQALKLEVRDAVLDYLEREMPEEADVAETTDWIRRHTAKIEQTAGNTVREAGYDYPVSAAVTTCFFPDKTYGDVTFPAGNYEALRVEIGAAQGQNWWCVLYPNLCFLDTVNAVVPDEGKQKLKNVLTEEEYSQVTAVSDFKIRWFFWK
ncbi:MAG TPA: stage II sporulation protein R [Candidatus Mediterraneibacter cottocaccae]|nr:stage II sporulation protein R [Candidatus Mediterraneibacter cottocaccae]